MVKLLLTGTLTIPADRNQTASPDAQDDVTGGIVPLGFDAALMPTNIVNCHVFLKEVVAMKQNLSCVETPDHAFAELIIGIDENNVQDVGIMFFNDDLQEHTVTYNIVEFFPEV